MAIRWNAPLRGSVLAAVALALACSERPHPAAPVLATDATAPSATQATSYSGHATVVQAKLFGPVPAAVTLVDAGSLPSSGGAREASLLDASVPGLLTAEVLHATSVGQGNASRSEASVAELALTVGTNSISAGFLEARATAMCTDGGATASGMRLNLFGAVNAAAPTDTGAPALLVTSALEGFKGLPLTLQLSSPGVTQCVLRSELRDAHSGRRLGEILASVSDQETKSTPMRLLDECAHDVADAIERQLRR